MRAAAALVLAGLAASLPARASDLAPPPPDTGWTLQGLPLVSYNSDEGFGYGARVLLIDRGTGRELPFRHSLMAQFYQTTKGVAAHRIFFDAPGFLGSPYRIDADVAWSIDKFSPWYGLGNQSVYLESRDTCADREALAKNPDVCPGNPAFLGARYYRYDRNTLPRIKLNLRRDLRGPWKLFGGYRFTLNHITPFYGPDDLGQTGDSQLAADARAGRLVGWDGSRRAFDLRTSEVTAGVVYDSRDNEPAPTSGMFHEVSARAGLRALGSQFDYRGVNATARFYQYLFDRSLVAALRAIADVQGGDVPFLLLPTTGGLDGPDGVGGLFSARGLLKNRLQGKVKLLVTPELRWRFYQGARLGWELVTAIDVGRVWSELGRAEAGGLKAGAAAGIRAAWNRNFLVRLDTGFGLTEPYGTGSVYLTFDEMF